MKYNDFAGPDSLFDLVNNLPKEMRDKATVCVKDINGHTLDIYSSYMVVEAGYPKIIIATFDSR